MTGPGPSVAAVKARPPRRGPLLPRDRGSSVRSVVSIRGTEQPRPKGVGDKEGSGPSKSETSPCPSGSEARETTQS